MTKQTLNYLTIAFVLFNLLLIATPSSAQKLARRHTLPAAPQQTPSGSGYTWTFIDFPETLVTAGIGINFGTGGSGLEIVGCYGAASFGGANSFKVRGTVHKKIINEAFEDISIPGSTEQEAKGVNDSGVIVGNDFDSSDIQQGWELNGSVFTVLDVPFAGATGTATEGINNAGEIVGGWSDSSGNDHGFTLIGGTGGTYSSFDYPGAADTWAWGLNNEGVIVGYYDDSGSNATHGFSLSGGTYTSIDVPGAVETIAIGINDLGDIVGVYCTTEPCIANFDGAQGFLLSKGVFTTISAPGSTYTESDGINNQGMIVGLFTDINNGPLRTYLAVP